MTDVDTDAVTPPELPKETSELDLLRLMHATEVALRYQAELKVVQGIAQEQIRVATQNFEAAQKVAESTQNEIKIRYQMKITDTIDTKTRTINRT